MEGFPLVRAAVDKGTARQAALPQRPGWRQRRGESSATSLFTTLRRLRQPFPS